MTSHNVRIEIALSTSFGLFRFAPKFVIKLIKSYSTKTTTFVTRVLRILAFRYVYFMTYIDCLYFTIVSIE